MKNKTLLLAVLVLTLTNLACATAEKTKNSSSLSHYTPTGDANWSENDGVIYANKGKGYLVTKESYKNFKISLEFYAAPNSNSGIFVRCSEPENINDKTCYEINIFDTLLDQSGRTGAVTNLFPPLKVIDTEGQWNTLVIAVMNNHLVVILNGEVTVDNYDSALSSGPIALQYMQGEIEFKNVQITEL